MQLWPAVRPQSEHCEASAGVMQQLSGAGGNKEAEILESSLTAGGKVTWGSCSGKQWSRS